MINDTSTIQMIYDTSTIVYVKEQYYLMLELSGHSKLLLDESVGEEVALRHRRLQGLQSEAEVLRRQQQGGVFRVQPWGTEPRYSHPLRWTWKTDEEDDGDRGTVGDEGNLPPDGCSHGFRAESVEVSTTQLTRTSGHHRLQTDVRTQLEPGMETCYPRITLGGATSPPHYPRWSYVTPALPSVELRHPRITLGGATWHYVTLRNAMLP